MMNPSPPKAPNEVLRHATGECAPVLLPEAELLPGRARRDINGRNQGAAHGPRSCFNTVGSRCGRTWDEARARIRASDRTRCRFARQVRGMATARTRQRVGDNRMTPDDPHHQRFPQAGATAWTASRRPAGAATSRLPGCRTRTQRSAPVRARRRRRHGMADQRGRRAQHRVLAGGRPRSRVRLLRPSIRGPEHRGHADGGAADVGNRRCPQDQSQRDRAGRDVADGLRAGRRRCARGPVDEPGRADRGHRHRGSLPTRRASGRADHPQGGAGRRGRGSGRQLDSMEDRRRPAARHPRRMEDDHRPGPQGRRRAVEALFGGQGIVQPAARIPFRRAGPGAFRRSAVQGTALRAGRRAVRVDGLGRHQRRVPQAADRMEGGGTDEQGGRRRAVAALQSRPGLVLHGA